MSTPTASPRILAPRYQTRFACIGSACEDTCCAGWTIHVDEEHFREMRAVLGETREGAALFDANVKRVSIKPTKERHALVVLNSSSGRCNFLDDRSLCKLQSRYGERVLPTVCATYPRRQSVVHTTTEDRREMALLLSCPEAARLALLAKDAMELVDVDGAQPREREQFVQWNDGSVLYDAALDVVRSTLLAIMSGAPSLEGGLATLAALADALGEGFSRDAKAPIEPEVLLETLEAFTAPEVAQQIHRDLAATSIPLAVPMRTLLEVLAKRVALPEGHFGALLRHVIAAYGVSQTTIVRDVVEAYVARRDAVLPLVGVRLDEMLSNYVQQHVFAYWYTQAPDLGIYIRGIIVRIAFLRFLVFAHPDVHALKEAKGATPSDATPTIERALVEVVSKMTRDIDHHASFVALLDRVLPAAMPGLEHALTLLKL